MIIKILWLKFCFHFHGLKCPKRLLHYLAALLHLQHTWAHIIWGLRDTVCRLFALLVYKNDQILHGEKKSKIKVIFSGPVIYFVWGVMPTQRDFWMSTIRIWRKNGNSARIWHLDLAISKNGQKWPNWPKIAKNGFFWLVWRSGTKILTFPNILTNFETISSKKVDFCDFWKFSRFSYIKVAKFKIWPFCPNFDPKNLVQWFFHYIKLISYWFWGVLEIWPKTVPQIFKKALSFSLK